MLYMIRISIRNKDGQEQKFKKLLSVFFPKAHIVYGICIMYMEYAPWKLLFP